MQVLDVELLQERHRLHGDDAPELEDRDAVRQEDLALILRKLPAQGRVRVDRGLHARPLGETLEQPEAGHATLDGVLLLQQGHVALRHRDHLFRVAEDLPPCRHNPMIALPTLDVEVTEERPCGLRLEADVRRYAIQSGHDDRQQCHLLHEAAPGGRKRLLRELRGTDTGGRRGYHQRLHALRNCRVGYRACREQPSEGRHARPMLHAAPLQQRRPKQAYGHGERAQACRRCQRHPAEG
mmetsp:Transcript_4288/g.10335  ORF Transcript_4288/g.10335 Transcript_4288/m.10335 type:complete len:239 (+) Transcript_4288:322-1038(+)